MNSSSRIEPQNLCADAGPNSPRSPLFRRGDLVRHLKTKGVYQIVHTPATVRIEADLAPAYAYRLHTFPFGGGAPRDGYLWIRPQGEMEDGRFEPVEAQIEGEGSRERPND